MPAKTKSTAKAKAAAKARRDKAEATRKAERDSAIKSGELVEGKGNIEFHRIDNGKPGSVEKRAAGVLKALRASDTPVAGKDLAKKLGGGWPQYLGMFSMLKAQGLITEYRQRSGERGGGGVAYTLNE
jgi:hypothetical protein